ncbi:MAG: hypothetical protein ACLRVT_09215, partial [Oscillospiraceae bacterium]
AVPALNPIVSHIVSVPFLLTVFLRRLSAETAAFPLPYVRKNGMPEKLSRVEQTAKITGPAAAANQTAHSNAKGFPPFCGWEIRRAR